MLPKPNQQNKESSQILFLCSLAFQRQTQQILLQLILYIQSLIDRFSPTSLLSSTRSPRIWIWTISDPYWTPRASTCGCSSTPQSPSPPRTAPRNWSAAATPSWKASTPPRPRLRGAAIVTTATSSGPTATKSRSRTALALAPCGSLTDAVLPKPPIPPPRRSLWKTMTAARIWILTVVCSTTNRRRF